MRKLFAVIILCMLNVVALASPLLTVSKAVELMLQKRTDEVAGYVIGVVDLGNGTLFCIGEGIRSDAVVAAMRTVMTDGDREVSLAIAVTKILFLRYPCK